jgi:hypothetical protein
MRLAKLPGALVIITGLLIVTGACILEIYDVPNGAGDWAWLTLMFLVGTGAIAGGSDLTVP